MNRTVSQRELRNDSGAVLREVESGRSVIITRRTEGQTTPLPDDILEIAIPDSAHHVMVDQPLALVAALRSLLAVWPA